MAGHGMAQIRRVCGPNRNENITGALSLRETPSHDSDSGRTGARSGDRDLATARSYGGAAAVSVRRSQNQEGRRQTHVIATACQIAGSGAPASTSERQPNSGASEARSDRVPAHPRPRGRGRLGASAESSLMVRQSYLGLTHDQGRDRLARIEAELIDWQSRCRPMGQQYLAIPGGPAGADWATGGGCRETHDASGSQGQGPIRQLDGPEAASCLR
jgi:hypothetical protein